MANHLSKFCEAGRRTSGKLCRTGFAGWNKSRIKKRMKIEINGGVLQGRSSLTGMWLRITRIVDNSKDNLVYFIEVSFKLLIISQN